MDLLAIAAIGFVVAALGLYYARKERAASRAAHEDTAHHGIKAR